MRTKKLAITGVFMALAVVGAFIKIQGTIAFDSLPAFVVGGLLGPLWGGAAGALAHLISAIINGFPLGLPAHLIVAGMMFLAVAVFAIVYRRVNKWAAMIAGIIMNGPVSLLPFYFMIGKEFYIGLLPILTIAASLNLVLALVVLTAFEVGLKGNKTYQEIR